MFFNPGPGLKSKWFQPELWTCQCFLGSSHLVVSNYGTMVNKSPQDRVVGPLPNGRTSWLINGGDPNYLRVLGWSSKWYVDWAFGNRNPKGSRIIHVPSIMFFCRVNCLFSGGSMYIYIYDIWIQVISSPERCFGESRSGGEQCFGWGTF